MAYKFAFPQPLIVPPTGAHKFTVILLHGRGSDGEEFCDDLFQGQLTSGGDLHDSMNRDKCKCVFPSAHERWSTTFQEEMQEWFDIRSLSDPESDGELQKDGLRESVELINEIIEEELQLVPASHIILGGISQGFAVAIQTLLSRKETFAGFIGMSGGVPFKTQLQQASTNPTLALVSFYRQILGIQALTSSDTFKTPICISHSVDDCTVDVQLGKDAADTLRALGMRVQYHEHEDGEHWLQEPRGHDDLSRFLTSRIAQPTY